VFVTTDDKNDCADGGQCEAEKLKSTIHGAKSGERFEASERGGKHAEHGNDLLRERCSGRIGEVGADDVVLLPGK